MIAAWTPKNRWMATDSNRQGFETESEEAETELQSEFSDRQEERDFFSLRSVGLKTERGTNQSVTARKSYRT